MTILVEVFGLDPYSKLYQRFVKYPGYTVEYIFFLQIIFYYVSITMSWSIVECEFLSRIVDLVYKYNTAFTYFNFV